MGILALALLGGALAFFLVIGASVYLLATDLGDTPTTLRVRLLCKCLLGVSLLALALSLLALVPT